MMKKRTAALLSCLLILSCFLLTACGGQEAPETTAAPTEAVEQTLTGTGTMTWHGNVKFCVVADVTVKGDVIQNVSLRDSSLVTTDAFTGWVDNRDEFLGRFVGVPADEILAMEALSPDDSNDHEDGGSVSGGVDGITGATASSNVVVRAIQDALSKLEAQK